MQPRALAARGHRRRRDRQRLVARPALGAPSQLTRLGSLRVREVVAAGEARDGAAVRRRERQHGALARLVGARLRRPLARRRARRLDRRAALTAGRRVLRALDRLIDRHQVGPVGAASDAEVDDAHAAVVADQHVVGLEVAVDEPRRVRPGEALPGLDEDLERLVDAARPLREPAGQAHPVDQLHRQVHDLAERVGVVHRDHVGVRELGQRLRLAQQAGGDVAGLRPGPRVHHLERDPAIEARVVRRVDHAHRPGADAVEDHVAVDRRPALKPEHLGGRLVALPLAVVAVAEGTAAQGVVGGRARVGAVEGRPRSVGAAQRPRSPHEPMVSTSPPQRLADGPRARARARPHRAVHDRRRPVRGRCRRRSTGGRVAPTRTPTRTPSRPIAADRDRSCERCLRPTALARSN